MEISPSFARQLAEDGFEYIGTYKIHENAFKIQLPDEKVRSWRLPLYTFVSCVNGGKHLRIGIIPKRTLGARMREWENDVTRALNERFRPQGTKRWEVEGWRAYPEGLLYAQQVVGPTEDETIKRLKELEKKFQDDDLYNPPLCNNTKAGKKLKAEWERKNR